MSAALLAGSGRTPVVLQNELAECGLACLAMIACHHGHDLDLASLRRRFPVSLQGASLARLIGIAAELVHIRRLSQIKAADRPPAHERPRLFAARAEERRPDHVHTGTIAHPRA